MFTISFDYNGTVYNALVNEKYPANKQYRITVMNGELEKLLHGNNVIMVDDMEMKEQGTLPGEMEKLLTQIRTALIKYLQLAVAS
ncbi:MAG TPA: hypothetical protein VMY77_11380 [Chitinophagaceae bacterium]|nr:hypothetical protein [Chitinophagaceae bacterium]